MIPNLRHFTQQAARRLSAVLPSSCALCGVNADAAICGGCHAQFFTLPPNRCVQCASALPHAAAVNARCGKCLNDPPAFDATIVATDYVAPVDQLVLALKFGGNLALAPMFAHLLHDAWQRAQVGRNEPPALLTVVPLGAQRLVARGFNQAQEIARTLAPLLAVPLYPKIAIRVRDTAEQAQLPPKERRKNIRAAFTASPDAIDRIQGKHVGIVDDVMTTGETLNELAATLKRFGAARVSNFVFARSTF